MICSPIIRDTSLSAETWMSTETAAQQIVGRERRERLSQLAWCGGGCFDSRRRVNSDVRAHRCVRTASGSDPIKAQLEWMIPSLPLRVLTRTRGLRSTNLLGNNDAALPRFS